MRPLLLACASLLALPASAQQFVRNTAQIPAQPGDFTEQVDFADVDLDGDWDAAFATGGDLGNQQNRLWINQGGAQGGSVGTFAAATASRFPAILDASRDIEFGDWDADGDADVFVSNHCQATNQPSRFWTNQGGIQGGGIGFYVDETTARWIGLGGPGSSIPPSQLVGGGFVNFCWDSDFADLDNDGDLDLIHSSAGGAQSGQAPTRLFLNDGTGHYSEFNPSGFQLTSLNIVNGNPGLWCEGLQQANTMNSTGQFCDIADVVISIDPGDIDGDFDLDLVRTPQDELPRMFVNRSMETGGLAFRDATSAVFQPGYSTGNGHYEETFGDFDADADFDIYGLNWLVAAGSFTDAFLRNNGDGTYAAPVPVTNSQSDDEDPESIDFDLDGDLDVFIANFSGQDRMYRNNGTGTFTLATGVLPSDSTTSKDGDTADVDADGDPDLFVANDAGQACWFLMNTTAADDTTPPRVGPIEQAADRAPSGTPTAVRVHVYDNASYQVTHYDDVQVEARENKGSWTSSPMRSSRGQVFRGEIDGTLTGLVSYRVIAADEYANTTTSPVRVYAAGTNGSGFCFGDTGACPCGNNSPAGIQSGCVSSLGVGARLVASGTSSVANDTLVLAAGPLPETPALFFQGTAQVNGGAGNPFGDGLRCAGGTIRRLGIQVVTNSVTAYPAAGDLPVSQQGQVPAAGGTRHYQLWYRNAANFCTASTFNLTNAWTVVWTP